VRFETGWNRDAVGGELLFWAAAGGFQTRHIECSGFAVSEGRQRLTGSDPDQGARCDQCELNFWSGPKVDMEKQADGLWTVTTPPMAPGLHYYTIIVDGAEVSDPGSTAYFGGSKWASAVEVPEAGADYYLPEDVPHGQVREI
jgi:hypothetical protein